MKIICVTPDDLSTLIMCKTLSRLLAKYPNMELTTISGKVEGQSAELYREDVDRDVISNHINLPMKRFISPFYDILYTLKLYGILKIGKYDVIITFATKPNIYGQIAAFLAGVPHRVMAVRGLGRIFNVATTKKEKITKMIVVNLYALSCRIAKRVWFTNRIDEEEFLKRKLIHKEKIFLTKNAVDLTDFSIDKIDKQKIEKLKDELNIKESDRVVIMVARMIDQKGIFEYANCALQTYDRLPNVKFLLVAPLEKEFTTKITPEFLHDIESKSNFQWLGFRKDVRELYALSDLSVLPSYYKEGGYPRALLEAMAYGKPVIGADTLECRGPVEDGRNGYLVPPKDINALTDAVYKIMSNTELRTKMGQHSLCRVKAEFDDTVVFTSLINEVIIPASMNRDLLLN